MCSTSAVMETHSHGDCPQLTCPIHPSSPDLSWQGAMTVSVDGLGSSLLHVLCEEQQTT